MSPLQKIFAPIVDVDSNFTIEHLFNKAARQDNPKDDRKIFVAFDTMGTLVHTQKRPLSRTQFVADEAVSRFALDLIKHKDRLGIDVALISSGPKEATEALLGARLGRLLDHAAVENKVLFYGQRSRDKRTVIGVDDDFVQGMMADGWVNPKSETVKDYLKRREYLTALQAA